MAFINLAIANEKKLEFGIAYNAGTGHAEKIGSDFKDN